MEDVRTEIKWAIEGIQTIVDDLDMIVTDFNDTIEILDYQEYVTLIKALRKELADVQVKSWGNRLKLKVKEAKEDKAVEEMMIQKMKEYMIAQTKSEEEAVDKELEEKLEEYKKKGVTFDIGTPKAVETPVKNTIE